MNPTQLERSCVNCKFFVPVCNKNGECRHSPPQVSGSGGRKGMFPVIGKDNWCSYYMPSVVIPTTNPGGG
jgi:hypothetical protein